MTDSGSHKILIVDDFELMRVSLTRVLNEMGLTDIKEASNGKQAIEALRTASTEGHPFKLVFLDWNMPVMSGIDVLKTCKKDPVFKDTLFVMVTAEADRPKVMDALVAGAADYITKPCSLDNLKSKMTRIMGKIPKAS